MQAAKWRGRISTNRGVFSLHAWIAYGQRVWNAHPEGELIGEGTSPSSTMRLREDSISGSGTGTAEINAFV
jgi:hypothetical protein